MIAGMSTACFFPLIYNEQAVLEMGKMGIHNIEVFFSCFSEYKIPFAKEIKKRADDYNINIYSIHALSLQFEPQLFTTHERARQDSLGIYQQVLEAGAELGAKVYVFHGPAHVKHARKMHLNYPFIGEYVDPIAEMAKQYNIKLAWENVHWCWYAYPDFPMHLSRNINTDNLYYTLDVKQAAQAGFVPTDYLSATKGRLVNVHLCDFDIADEKGISPKLPFDGSMDIAALKTSLVSFKYNGPVILEVYSNNYKDYTELQNNFEKVKSFFGKR